MTTATRKPLQPATGRVKWLKHPDEDGDGVLAINDKAYLVSRNRASKRKGSPTVGYRLAHLEDGQVIIYDIDIQTDLWTCECGDYQWRRANAPTPELRLCKHCKGLRAALKQLSQE